MSSVGQAVGMVVGGIIGFFAGGNVMLGASIGGAIGGAIDPPKGPKIEGPRLNDLSVQTSTYGAQIPVIKGSVATFGNIFWVENNALKETKKTEEQGGKGGGGAETTTYSYSATFALGLCLGPVDGIRRIWCSGKLLFDSGDSSLSAVVASNFVGMAVNGLLTIAMKATPETTGNGAIRFYNGGPLQEPDPRMQAALGVDNTPAYRGLAYIVFEDFQLADFGNSLMGAQFKVEIVDSASFNQYAMLTRVQSGLFPEFADEYGDAGASTVGPYNPVLEDGLMRFDKERTRYTVSLEGVLISRGEASGIDPGSVGDPGERFFVGTTSGGIAVYYDNTGPFSSGYLMVGWEQFASRFSPGYELQGACVGHDGNLYLHQYKGGGCVLEKYDGNDLSLIWTHSATALPYNLTTSAFPYLPGTTACSAVNEGNLYWFLSIAGLDISFTAFSIAADGGLTSLHTFDEEGGSGWLSNSLSGAASGGLCAVANSNGGFYVFDTTPITVPSLVPLSEIVSFLCLQSNLLTAGDIDVTALTQEVRGYRITETAAIRASIEPLRACWPFDAVQSGYKIKFVPRGVSSVATVSEGDLGAVSSGEKSGIRTTVAREMDTQLPRRVETKFIDAAREYDVGTGPGTERLNTDAINILQVDLPVVLIADEAAAVEQTLLYMYWMERHDISFVLPPTFQNLEPSDVITVNAPGATHVVRLVNIQYLPDGRLECSAKHSYAPVYTPIAVGEAGAVTGQVLTYAGPTVAALLDVPCMDSTVMDRPGLLAAVSGVYSSWAGGTLLRSEDGGQSYQAIESFVAPGSIIGSSDGSLESGPTHIVDAKNQLNVRLASGSLSSVTLLAMYNGANHFAYGAHGRWEIIAAQTITQESDDTYTLRDLLRGRFGTEQYVTTHSAYDSIVLLDQSRLRFISMDVSSINLTRLWRAVSRGRAIDSASDTSLAYAAVNLECLSPIYLGGSRHPSTFDWTLTWTRRSRTGVEPFSGVVTPLGETSEDYEVEIYSDGGYGTLKRTITGLSSATCSYSAAQQITDFGAEQQTLYVKVYQVSTRVGRGYPLIGFIDRYVPLDPYIDLLVLGIHFNGTNGSTTFTDIKGHTFTAFGNAQLSTTGQKYGTACGIFDGSGDYIRAPYSSDWSPGSGDYCVEGWINPTTISILRTIVSAYYNPSATYGWNFAIDSSGALYVNLRDSGGNYYNVGTAGSVISAGVWQHVAFSKQGTTYRIFASGVKQAEQTISAVPYVDPSCGLIFGRWDDSGESARDFYGTIDDFRIYKGAAVRTADFTPPSGQFPDS